MEIFMLQEGKPQGQRSPCAQRCRSIAVLGDILKMVLHCIHGAALGAFQWLKDNFTDARKLLVGFSPGPALQDFSLLDLPAPLGQFWKQIF